MKFLLSYLRERRAAAGVFLLFCLIFLTAFLLYRLPAGASAVSRFGLRAAGDAFSGL